MAFVCWSPGEQKAADRIAAEHTAVRSCIRTHSTVLGHPKFMLGCVRHLVVVSTLQAATCCGWPLLLQLVRTMLCPALTTCAAPPGHHPYYPCQALWRHQAGRRRAGQGIWRRCSGLPASGTQDVCEAAGEDTGTAMSCCRSCRGRDTRHDNCLACHLEGYVLGGAAGVPVGAAAGGSINGVVTHDFTDTVHALLLGQDPCALCCAAACNTVCAGPGPGQLSV